SSHLSLGLVVGEHPVRCRGGSGADLRFRYGALVRRGESPLGRQNRRTLSTLPTVQRETRSRAVPITGNVCRTTRTNNHLRSVCRRSVCAGCDVVSLADRCTSV